MDLKLTLVSNTLDRMNYYIDIQQACNEPLPFSDEQLRHGATLALSPYRDTAELTLRFVNVEEITHLNTTYRKMNKATNVLAFPATYPDDVELEYPLLGDIIVCPAVLKQESLDLNKPLEAHWALIVMHGTLHLLGYDHIKDEDAEIMQSIETKLLTQLGFPSPYESDSEDN